jgi:putative sigma-54 modulation protein
MTIQLSAKNFELTQPLRDYVDEKVGRLARYDGELGLAHVRISRDQHHKHGEVFTIHVHLSLTNHSVSAQANAGDPYAATDIVQEKLEREVEHWRGRSESKNRRLGRILSPRAVGMNVRKLGHLPRRQWRWIKSRLNRQDSQE